MKPCSVLSRKQLGLISNHTGIQVNLEESWGSAAVCCCRAVQWAHVLPATHPTRSCQHLPAIGPPWSPIACSSIQCPEQWQDVSCHWGSELAVKPQVYFSLTSYIQWQIFFCQQLFPPWAQTCGTSPCSSCSVSGDSGGERMLDLKLKKLTALIDTEQTFYYVCPSPYILAVR